MHHYLQVYTDFNSAACAELKAAGLGGGLAAGSCSYCRSNNSVFFLPDATLTYVARGKKYMFVGKREYVLEAGHLLYLPANTTVYTHIYGGTENFKSINLVLGKVSGKAGSERSLKNEPVYFSPSRSVSQFFGELDNKLSGHWAWNSPDAASKLFELIGQEISSDGPIVRLHERDVEMMVEALSKYTYDYEDLECIASNSNMSLATFKRKFGLLFGQAPKSWIRATCLQTAYFKLRTGTMDVSDASRYVGFESPSHFSQAFKKYFRISPSRVSRLN